MFIDPLRADEKDAIISALRTENTQWKFKAQSYYDKYWAAENELTATRDELDRIKNIVKQNNLSLDLENK